MVPVGVVVAVLVQEHLGVGSRRCYLAEVVGVRLAVFRAEQQEPAPADVARGGVGDGQGERGGHGRVHGRPAGFQDERPHPRGGGTLGHHHAALGAFGVIGGRPRRRGRGQCHHQDPGLCTKPHADGSLQPGRTCRQQEDMIAAVAGAHLVNRNFPTFPELQTLGAEQSLAPGEVLWQEGDPGDHVVFLVDGTLEVTHEPPEGEVVVLRTMYPGAVVGEMAALDGQSRSATVRARAACRILKIPSSKFRDFLRHAPRHPRGALLASARARAQPDLAGHEDASARDHRPPDPPLQLRVLPRAPRDRGRPRAIRPAIPCRSPSSTSTTSRASTTPTATTRATRCWSAWPRSCKSVGPPRRRGRALRRRGVRGPALRGPDAKRPAVRRVGAAQPSRPTTSPAARPSRGGASR